MVPPVVQLPDRLRRLPKLVTLPSVDDRPPTSARWTRLLELAAQITGRKGGRSDRVERWLLGAALSIFIGIIAVSWVNLPDAPGTPVPGWALVAGGLAILTLCQDNERRYEDLRKLEDKE